MFTHWKYRIFFIIFFFTVSSRAEIYYLDLETALNMAGKANPDMVVSVMDFESADMIYHSVRAELYPSLRMEMVAPDYSESLTQQYLYNPSTQTYGWRWMPTGDYRYQGTLFLEQKLPTGGDINIMSMLYKRDYYIGSSSDSLDSEYSNVMQLSVQQPLLQANAVSMSQKRSRLSFETARLNRDIRKRDLEYVVASAYYTLVRAERKLHLEQEDYQRWENSVKTAEAKFNAGLIPEVEALKLKVVLARREGSLAASMGAYQDSAEDLKIALGLQVDDSIAVSDNVRKVDFEPGDRDRAMENLQEMRKASINLEQSKLDYRETKSQYGLNAYLQAYYQFDSKEADLALLTDNYEQDRGLSFTLNVPILDWKASGRKVEAAAVYVKKSQYNLEQTKKNYISLLNQAERNLANAESRCTSSALAEELAKRSYDITLARFETGAVTSTELIDAQVALNEARHESLDALIDYNLAAVKYKTLFFP